MDLDVLHHSTVDIHALYSARRMELIALMPAQMEGLIGTTPLTIEDMARLAPRMAELDCLIESIRGRAAADAADAQKALLDLRDAAEPALGRRLELEFKN